MAKLPAYRHAWATDRRCLVPASSFVEWQVVAGSRRKQPWLVYFADRRQMAFAGLWEYSHTEGGGRVESCTIVTAPANALMTEIHNTRKRMPVVLEGRFEQDAWLGRHERGGPGGCRTVGGRAARCASDFHQDQQP